jgi:hypothetical protein
MNTLTRLTTALADRYHVRRELGAGGMATVHLACDVRHILPLLDSGAAEGLLYYVMPFAPGVNRRAHYSVGGGRVVGVQRADSSGRLVVIAGWLQSLKLQQ